MISLDRARTAVLVMDFQTAILKMAGDVAAPAIDATAAVVRAARASGVPVIYVVIGFRAGYPEIGPGNERFAQLAKAGLFLVDRPGSDVHPSLAPEPTDIVVVKHRVSAFFGTDLEMILRVKSIDTLVLCGISTSGIVLSTTRQAFDMDYRVVVVEDGCADADAEVHRVLMGKVLARQVTVAPSTDVVAALG